MNTSKIRSSILKREIMWYTFAQGRLWMRTGLRNFLVVTRKPRCCSALQDCLPADTSVKRPQTTRRERRRSTEKTIERTFPEHDGRVVSDITLSGAKLAFQTSKRSAWYTARFTWTGQSNHRRRPFENLYFHYFVHAISSRTKSKRTQHTNRT